MDQREEQIAQLKQAIKDAKRLQSELKQTGADIDRIYGKYMLVLPGSVNPINQTRTLPKN